MLPSFAEFKSLARKVVPTGTVCLAVWFLLTNIGLPVFSVAAEHPDCPCGCNSGQGCRTEAGTKSSCCSNGKHEQTSCCSEATHEECCCRPDEESPAGWQALCLCGQVDCDQITLTETLDLPPHAESLPGVLPQARCPSASITYQNPLIIPQTPPPQAV